ncbi:MAG: DbpA RNA binding domain-containing protein [Anaerolineaceae bacterium]|nr:DbpA RNA binding domain-containing protein [Anaerolineaceae bacterium]
MTRTDGNDSEITGPELKELVGRPPLGAIAGETGIPSRSIGKIDIFDRHTFVDVSGRDLSHILKASDGKYKLRGKSVRLKLAAK